MESTLAIHRKILRWLENELFEGNLQIGQDLPDDNRIARAIGVGRSRTREGLKILEDMDLVHLYSGKGKEIIAHLNESPATAAAWPLRLHMSMSDYPMRDLVQTHMLLEGWSVANIDPATADFGELDELLEEMQLGGYSISEFLDLYLDFHLAVCQLAGNQMVNGLLLAIRDSTFESLLSLTGRMSLWSSTMERLNAQNRAILEAIKDGDAATARSLMSNQMRGLFDEAGVDIDESAINLNGIPGTPGLNMFEPVDIEEDFTWGSNGSSLVWDSERYAAQDSAPVQGPAPAPHTPADAGVSFDREGTNLPLTFGTASSRVKNAPSGQSQADAAPAEAVQVEHVQDAAAQNAATWGAANRGEEGQLVHGEHDDSATQPLSDADPAAADANTGSGAPAAEDTAEQVAHAAGENAQGEARQGNPKQSESPQGDTAIKAPWMSAPAAATDDSANTASDAVHSGEDAPSSGESSAAEQLTAAEPAGQSTMAEGAEAAGQQNNSYQSRHNNQTPDDGKDYGQNGAETHGQVPAGAAPAATAQAEPVQAAHSGQDWVPVTAQESPPPAATGEFASVENEPAAETSAHATVRLADADNGSEVDPEPEQIEDPVERKDAEQRRVAEQNLARAAEERVKVIRAQSPSGAGRRHGQIITPVHATVVKPITRPATGLQYPEAAVASATAPVAPATEQQPQVTPLQGEVPVEVLLPPVEDLATTPIRIVEANTGGSPMVVRDERTVDERAPEEYASAERKQGWLSRMTRYLGLSRDTQQNQAGQDAQPPTQPVEVPQHVTEQFGLAPNPAEQSTPVASGSK